MGTAHAQSVLGWIAIKPLPGRRNIQVTGHALALGQVSGADFTLSMHRKNGGNTSNGRQSGRFDLDPGESTELSTSTINFESGDDLSFELVIRVQATEVSRSVVSSRRNLVSQTP